MIYDQFKVGFSLTSLYQASTSHSSVIFQMLFVPLSPSGLVQFSPTTKEHLSYLTRLKQGLCYVHILCFTQSKKHHHSLRGLSGLYNMLKPIFGFLQHSLYQKLSNPVLVQSTVSQSFGHSSHRVYEGSPGSPSSHFFLNRLTNQM